ncbi:MAG: DNA alkylation repair protein [Blastocatellia bacterium AA13]|nr:MAG: DNA alkylation repair protein [Blastocatellia bacterium AA13]
MPATTAKAILKEIEPLGKEGYKKVLFNHGVTGPCFGVKIEELKKIQKRIKKDYQLALDLYDTGVYDAMYLAGLIADDAKMTKSDLRGWLKKACPPLATSTVAWVAAESRYGWDLALEWIESNKEISAAAGWATLSSLVSIKADSDLDLGRLKQLLERLPATIHEAPNKARAQMNGFIIAVGSYVSSLTNLAAQVGKEIGPVTVDVGNTSCRVPFAPDYIRKAEQRGIIGKKRKTAKC